MKLSLKFREETQHQNPLLRAKIPVTILGLPFLSGIVAGDSSDLSFSLRSNFSSGPNLSLSYHPTLPTASGTFPFSLSLKSGIAVYGSPHNSPLVFTAKFNLFSLPSNPNPNPSSLTPIFSLQVKPQFGNFSLFKSVSSSGSSPVQLNGHAPNGNLPNGSGPDFEISNGLGHGSDGPEKPLAWSDLKRQSSNYREILSGILVAARTSMPLTKRAMVNFRWGVKLPPESNGNGSKTALPVLVVNKISVERVEEAKKVEDEKKRVEGSKDGELEVLKGMCSWMRREVEDLQRENREMKHILDGMKSQAPPGSRARRDEREIAGKRALPSPAFDGSNGFEKWRSKKNGGNGGVEENGSKESKKLSEVESELQKAIKAASS